jgi:hypothetical protein
MIAYLDESIKQLLVTDMPVKNGEIDIKFDQPNREWSNKLTKPTVNLFLYDLRENTTLRRSQFDQVGGNGSARDSVAKMKKAPHRLDCYYMLTTWAAEPEDEHRLMTRVLMSMFRNPTLPDHVLQGTVQNPQYPIQTHVARHDKLTNPAEVWSALDNEMRPSVCYSATLALDPWSVIEGPIVRTLTLRTGRSTRLPVQQEFDENGLSAELTYVGGTVRSKSGDNEPLAGLQVAIKGRGWFDQTDEDGRFTLGGMPAGDYTLVVWPETGKPKEKKISVPGSTGDFNLEL